MLTVSERLNTGRHRQFVGRDHERAIFREAIAAPHLPFLLLHLYGPGGVGKSALLREFAAQCQQAKLFSVSLDARDFTPSPESFLAALRQALHLPENADPIAFLAERSRRYILFIDTYEEIPALDGWLRDTFCPALPADGLLVLAGRYPPAVGWTSDSGWQSLLCALALRNLSPEEGRLLLGQNHVPAAQHQPILDFTHGHPLALALVADACRQRDDFEFAPEALPDVIQTLLNRFLQNPLSEAERAGLEIAAIVRVTTEPLLAEILPDADARALFDWLRGLACIETGRYGLFPHDLAREVLCADLRWRNPDRYAAWNRKARQYYDRRLRQTSVQEQQNVLANYLYLFHDDPIVRPFFDWSDIGGCYTDSLRPSDIPALIRMTTQYEGTDAADAAAYWLAHPAGRTHVVRDAQHGSANSSPVGYLTAIALHEIGEPERKRDPIAAAAWKHLAQSAPLRSGEQAILFRFWMADATYQAVSEIQSLILMNVIRLQLTTPGMAYAVLLCVAPDFWRPIAEFAEMPRVSDADCEINGQAYGFYEHDWRIMPPAAWLDMLAEKTDGLRPYFDAPPAAPPLTVLSHATFSEAVSDALRSYARPEGLRQNPLLRTRCVVAEAGHRAGDRDRIESLRLLVREAVEELQTAPRAARQYRALHRTYLQPIGSQSDAAEFLDLPFSTYRRHLTEGVASVVAALWQQEITGEK